MSNLLLHLGLGIGPDWVDWLVHPDAILLCLALEWGYLYAARELRPRLSDAGQLKRSQALLFHAGVLTLYLAGGTPLHDLGEEYLLSAHMVQQLLFTLVAAPLLLAGVPSWLWQALLRLPRVLPVARILTRPLFAFAQFNALILLTHLPATVDLALDVALFHFAIHGLLVVAAMLMWWPILSPLSELPRLSYPLQMAYLFLQSVLPSVMASFITFSDRVVYPFYAHAPRLWDGLDPMSDQQIAGGIMKLLGSIILWSFMGVAFFQWYRREEAESRGLPWDEVEHELDELGLTSRR